MPKLKTLLGTKPAFVFLLPVFFVFHGFTENFDFISLKVMFFLLALYFAISLVLVLLSRLFFRNFYKAALMTFFIMSVQFFFGSVHDILKKAFAGAFITKYGFLIPVLFILLILLIIILRKRKKSFFKCNYCTKPDTYLILADEYAGYNQLKNILHYDNSAFEKDLKNRGFHIVTESHSNYRYTPHSIASLMNMDYLKKIKLAYNNRKSVISCLDMINENLVGNFFKKK